MNRRNSREADETKPMQVDAKKDRKWLDDLVVQAIAVRLSKLSDAKYEIIVTAPNDREFRIDLRTSRTGSIEFKCFTFDDLLILNDVSDNGTIVSF